ncbi:transcriptional regulator [Actinomadura rubrobrunea]|uniref:Transcriptional regulator n=2 Tax=Actinomadura rubrobrunea TaxID=115335 RepID=A0A9W6PS01_9ACTN|nr:transcriptional regulator [Actinomadura rubrobrunea]
MDFAAEEQAVGLRRAGPTVLRMVVGARLRKLREASGISADQAGYEIRGSASKISRMELGRVGFKERDVADLLTLYGVTDPDEREALVELARAASVPGWWQRYHDIVPPWFEPYLGLEQGASVIRCYEVQVVPALLQTEDYARAVIRLTHPRASEEEIERRVALRRERQRILTRDDPARLWAVLDEAVLRRPFGGREVMRDQLRHLIDVCALRNVTVQVLPFGAGGHGALGGPITLLRFEEADLPDVVYLEQLTTAHYPDRRADVDHYTDIMNRLVVDADSPPKSLDTLRRLLAED